MFTKDSFVVGKTWKQLECHLTEDGPVWTTTQPTRGIPRSKRCPCLLLLSFSCRVWLFLRPHRLYPTILLCPWDSPGQEYWNELPFPSPRHFPDPGIEPRSPALQADALPSELLLANAKSSSKMVTSIYTFKKSFWGFQLFHILVKSFARFLNFFIFSNLVNIKCYLLVLIWLYLFRDEVLMNKCL